MSYKNSDSKTEEKKKNSKIWIPILSGVVAVAVIVIALVVFLSNNDDTPGSANDPGVQAPSLPTEPPTEPEIEPPPLLDLPDIPSNGGIVSVEEATVFHFIPSESGVWIFTTSENDGDPMLVIYNQYGVTIAEDDNSAENYNSHISIELEAGHRYTVYARFSSDDGEGSYSLTVEQ
jgi:hypothetical protein